MSNVTPVFLFHSLNTGRGGLTKAILKRANLFAQYYTVHFFTFTYQKHHEEIITNLKNTGELDERIVVHNFFTDIHDYGACNDKNVANWLQSRLKGINDPVIFSDSHHSHNILLHVPSSYKKVAVLHGNHLKDPTNPRSEVRGFLQPLFHNFEHFDRVVFLTQEQKQDVINKVGEYTHFSVIPHPCEMEKHRTSLNKRHPHLAVTLSRYTESKQLHEAITAFQSVIEQIPDAEYHIYGFGQSKKQLQQIIEDLQLQDNVKLKGFADDPVSIYESAACTILTSKHEGFGMVLTESLAAGTPVLSYPTKYGPSEIIRNEMDGYIVKDRLELSYKIKSFMMDPEQQQMMSKQAKKVHSRFHVKHYRRNWLKVIRDHSKQPSYQFYLKPIRQLIRSLMT